MSVTTEQLAIVVPGVAVVLVAGIGAWWQVRINKQTLDHQAKLALQARVATVYEELLEMIGWQMEAVDATKPIITMGEPSKPPEAPDTERIARSKPASASMPGGRSRTSSSGGRSGGTSSLPTPGTWTGCRPTMSRHR
jgi:hypothetical protein